MPQLPKPIAPKRIHHPLIRHAHRMILRCCHFHHFKPYEGFNQFGKHLWEFIPVSQSPSSAMSPRIDAALRIADDRVVPRRRHLNHLHISQCIHTPRLLHDHDERISVETYERGIEIYAALIEAFAGKHGGRDEL